MRMCLQAAHWPISPENLGESHVTFVWVFIPQTFLESQLLLMVFHLIFVFNGNIVLKAKYYALNF